jgi:signal transduction histidine kinase
LRSRAWLVLLLVWLPIAVGFPMAILMASGFSGIGPIVFGLNSVAIAAALGLGIWWLTGRLRWPDDRGARFYAIHLLLAVSYSWIWWLISASQQALFSGDRLIDVLREYAGSRWLGWDLLFGFLLYGLVAGISYTIRARDAFRRQRLSAARTEAELAQARLTALKAQLNPHFLFNALHSLSELVSSDPQAAEDGLDNLGEIMRYALDQAKRDEVLLQDEAAFVEDYLAIERLRLGDRLTVRTDIEPAALTRPVPPFTLQPLVENAIRHGVAPRPTGGVVEVTAKTTGDELVLEVKDDGEGADPKTVETTGGFGLRALRQRLASHRGLVGGLDLRTGTGAGFAARVSIRYEREPMQHQEAGAFPDDVRADSAHDPVVS